MENVILTPRWSTDKRYTVNKVREGGLPSIVASTAPPGQNSIMICKMKETSQKLDHTSLFNQHCIIILKTPKLGQNKKKIMTTITTALHTVGVLSVSPHDAMKSH